MKIKHLILGLSAAMLLAGCGGSSSEESSTSQRVEITSEQWDAAFEDVLNNFTYKRVIDNVTRDLMEFNGNGVHTASFNASGEKNESKEEYIQWTTDKNYIYYLDVDTKLWKKEEYTSKYEYATKEYQTNYQKNEMTFIGRFSDFSYDASKGGYFASTTKTTEVDGDIDGGYEMTNVLAKFGQVKITEINFRYNSNTLDGGTFADFSVTSIGSTTFDFPIIYE